jgi:hypothetical protein
MTEPAKTPSPFDLLIDQIRTVVREEIRAAGIALNGNVDSPRTMLPSCLTCP